MSHVHRLFLMLAVGDMAFFIYRPKWSNEKSGGLKKSIITDHSEETFLSISKILHMTGKLVFICNKLGNGCLFWLYGELSDNL